ncbi:unnamed protein product, partial [Meganyctiphanes norvegica]
MLKELIISQIYDDTNELKKSMVVHGIAPSNMLTENKVSLEEDYEVLKVIQEGWRGRLLLVEHRRTRREVVLKATHKDATSRLDFFREFHYNYYLSPHENILNAYDVAFQADDYFMFAQEYAPFADLTSNMTDIGLGEINAKRIAQQLASALEFMHSKDLVHRDINMDNILVFKSDFSKIKLCDFGSTRKKGTLLKKKNAWLSYAPPEIVDAVTNEGYHTYPSQDVWQFGVLIFVLLTGSLPWQKADLTDPYYAEYINWRKKRTLRTPKRFTNFTSRLLRMFKRLLEPKTEKRCSIKEIRKYLDDKWLVKLPRRDINDVDGQSICYSTYSMHSCPIEKDKILNKLKEHGIETTVDRTAKKKRIHEWIERSLSTRNLLDQKKDDLELSDEEEDGDQKELNELASRHPELMLQNMQKHTQESVFITNKSHNNRTTTNPSQDPRIKNGYYHAGLLENMKSEKEKDSRFEQKKTPSHGRITVIDTSTSPQGRSSHFQSPTRLESQNSPSKTTNQTQFFPNQNTPPNPTDSDIPQRPSRSKIQVIPAPESPARNNKNVKDDLNNGQNLDPQSPLQSIPRVPGKLQRREQKNNYELSRSKTDSYFITESKSSLHRQVSEDSDSSDDSCDDL